jgi:hypothetical protein
MQGCRTIQARSPKAAAFAPFPMRDPLATPKISSSYNGSKVDFFDATSIASGCYLETTYRAIGPAITCTIRYTGVKAESDEEVVFDIRFDAKGTGPYGSARQAKEVENRSFEGMLVGLKSLEPSILNSSLPGSGASVDNVNVRIMFDDFQYVAHVQFED